MRFGYLWDSVSERIRPWKGLPRTTLPDVRKLYPVEGWVICQVSIGGTPIRWFRYCPREVWRWTPTRTRAAVFPTKKDAEQAVTNSTVSGHHHSIVRLG